MSVMMALICCNTSTRIPTNCASFVQQNRRDLQIEHPYGKAKSFSAVLERNEVKFNRDNYQTLLVNGEVFPITPSNSK
jgi:hypothetical protein